MGHNASKKLITDANDTLFITKYADGSICVSVIEDNTSKAIEFVLTKRDIEEISDMIHSHDE